MKHSIQELVAKYVRQYEDLSDRKLASLILEEHDDIELSHRSVRRYIGKERSVAPETTTETTASTAVYTYKGEQQIHTLDDALSYFRVDVDKWEVDRYSCNSWEAQTKTGTTTLYQVKLQLKRKELPVDFSQILGDLRQTLDGFRIHSKPGSNTAVLALSDFHIGAKVKGIGNTPDFNVKTVVSRLQQVASEVNAGNYEDVYVCLLGDFIESFTGLNHQSTWHELEHEGFGTNIVITAYTILRRFLTSLDNVAGVYIVSGNHDRTSVKLEGDPQGSIAGLLAFMLKENTPLDIRHNPLILGVEIDSIYYLLTHNHYNISKGDLGKVFWEHGRQGMYNVMLGGHWHARKGSRVYRVTTEKQVDQANYRQLAVAPVFTGNFYSESNGWNSTAGYTLIINNGHGKPNVFEYVLS